MSDIEIEKKKNEKIDEKKNLWFTQYLNLVTCIAPFNLSYLCQLNIE